MRKVAGRVSTVASSIYRWSDWTPRAAERGIGLGAGETQ